jgi:hypothetical protein
MALAAGVMPLTVGEQEPFVKVQVRALVYLGALTAGAICFVALLICVPRNDRQTVLSAIGRLKYRPISEIFAVDFRLGNAGPKAGPSVIMVTRPGCHWCDTAKVALLEHNLRVQELSLDLPPVGTPSFLLLNDKGYVADGIEGWPSSIVGQASLFNRISREKEISYEFINAN